MMIRSRMKGFAGLLALGAALACNNDPTGNSGAAELRVLHATAALGAVDVYIGGTRVVQGIGFGSASPIVRVPAGAQHIEVRAGGAPIGTLDRTLSLAHINSLVIADGAPQWLGSVTPDTGQAASNRANIRMVNVVGPNSDPPAVLDVLVSAPNLAPDSIMTFGLDSRIASYGTLMYFDPGSFHFRFVPDGGGTTLTEITFSVAAGEKKAVVLERDASGVYRASVVVEP
jgi:hypothetical protein